jgi:hypothetical protein
LDEKPLWKSRTVWVHVGLLALLLCPAWKKFVSENPDAYIAIHSLLAIYLRSVTTTPISKG